MNTDKEQLCPDCGKSHIRNVDQCYECDGAAVNAANTQANQSTNLQDYLARFRVCPDNRSCVTMVTCVHPYHSHEVFYFSLDDYRDHFHGVTRLCWMNSYTMILSPLEGE